MEQRLRKLEAKITEIWAELKKDIKWVPEKGVRYWGITSLGNIASDTTDGGMTAYHIRTGNCYQTEELAQAARDKQLLHLDIREALAEANGDWEPDWSDDTQSKYIIAWDFGALSPIFNRYHTEQCCRCVAKTQQILEDLCTKYVSLNVCEALGAV